MRRSKYGVVSPPRLVALLAYQREADRQANRWIERELMGLMRGDMERALRTPVYQPAN